MATSLEENLLPVVKLRSVLRDCGWLAALGALSAQEWIHGP